MFQKKNPMSVFYDGYIERNPIEWVKRFGRQWKWAYQRATKGYCDADRFSINYWFLHTMPNMLDEMADNLHGYPCCFENSGATPNTQVLDLSDGDEISAGAKQWKAILNNMASLIRDADEDDSSIKNQYEEEWSKAYKEFGEQYGLFGEKLNGDIKGKNAPIAVHFPDEFPQWKDAMEKFRDEEVKVSQKREDNFREGMALFTKWFGSLWD